MTNRREFIIRAAGATSALGLGLAACSSKPDSSGEAAPAKVDKQGLNILILGGTGFIGPHMVRHALSRGHAVTLFNRGRTNAELFPEVTTLIGDRNSQLGALESGNWDAVIDNSGYIPRHVRESAELLSSRAAHYLFVSSISAYADLGRPGIDEGYALGQLDDESDENLTGETYGPMKALAERFVEDAFPRAATIVRPGYIVGPGDRTDRWTYWPLRVRAGGEMIVPGEPGDPVQLIDARDLAAFVVACIENGTLGTFNAVGPGDMLRMHEMLDSMKTTIGVDTRIRWMRYADLDERHAMFPIVASPEGEFAGAHRVSNARAIAAGLTFTSLETTTLDTLAWWDSLDQQRRDLMRSGLRVVDPDDSGARPGPMSLADQMALEKTLLGELANVAE